MAILAIEKAGKSFGGVEAVKNFTFEVLEGQIVGIIGPNGAGKTTIFNLISRIYDLDYGSMFLEGKDVTDYKPERISVEGIARTFQNIRLFSGLDVLNNVKAACDYKPRYSVIESLLMMPRRMSGEKAIEKEAMNCLEIAGLAHLAKEQPGNLPYGLQRRLEIARALAMKPKVLLLDEPAAGLNPDEALGLVDFLKDIMKKIDLSIVIIEHRMDVIMELCQNIYVQDFGQTIAVGSPIEIQSDPVVLSAYLGEEFEYVNN